MDELPWEDPTRGENDGEPSSALLTKKQRRKLLSDEGLYPRMRGRIRERLKHTLYDFAVLEENLRDRDLLQTVYAKDVFESQPSDEKAERTLKQIESSHLRDDDWGTADEELVYCIMSARILLMKATYFPLDLPSPHGNSSIKSQLVEQLEEDDELGYTEYRAEIRAQQLLQDAMELRLRGYADSFSEALVLMLEYADVFDE